LNKKLFRCTAAWHNLQGHRVERISVIIAIKPTPQRFKLCKQSSHYYFLLELIFSFRFEIAAIHPTAINKRWIGLLAPML